jgi:cytidyltransferase-like protein
MNTKQKIAFAAMRMQAFHLGHFNLISAMLRDNDTVIIGLGSTQIQKTMNNPYTPAQRKEMIYKVFGKTNKIKIIHLKDLGAVNKQKWVTYCMDQIAGKTNLPQPTRYYGGSETDISWFLETANLHGQLFDIKIVDRHSSGIMSATEIRKSIANAIINPEITTHEWKQSVPECLHNFLVSSFPQDLTLEYNINKNLQYTKEK